MKSGLQTDAIRRELAERGEVARLFLDVTQGSAPLCLDMLRRFRLKRSELALDTYRNPYLTGLPPGLANRALFEGRKGELGTRLEWQLQIGYDRGALISNAYKLHKIWGKNSQLRLVDDAGHSAFEHGTLRNLMLYLQSV